MDHDDEQAANVQQLPQAAEEPPAPLSEQLGFGVGTFLAAGAVDMFAHFGLTGLVVGGIAAYAAYQHGPQLLEQVRGSVPTHPAPARTRRNVPRRLAAHSQESRSKRSFLDRALGRFPDEYSSSYDDQEDTVIVTEADLPADQAWHGWHPASARRASEMVRLSPTLQVPIRDVAGKALFICGIRRHGKTTLGALLAEQLGAHFLPLFIPDLEGDYLSLADVLPRAVIAGHSRAAFQYTASAFAPLDSAAAAYQFGVDLLEYGYQVILDLSSYSSIDEAVAIQINVLRGMLHWTNTHPDRRVLCPVYLDEAQRYLPQTLSDSVIVNRTVLSMLLKCYMDMLGIGGKRGLAPVILTQRFAQVNNKIMAQSEVFFLLRQTHDTDLDRCMEYVDKSVASKGQIARFAPGQGVYLASDGSQIITQFAQRRSSGERSASPTVEAASRYASLPRYQQARAQAGEADSIMPPLEPTRAEPVAPERQPIAVPPVRNRPQTELERVIAAYRETPTASYRELGEKVGMGKDKVGDLLKEGRERGLLD